MAILNVTPDSFSDGGLNFHLENTLDSAHRFIAEGADILDIGGESSRPGADTVVLDDELRRVIPVIEHLAGSPEIALSIDTSKPEVARAALDAGAHIVNDISGFRDPGMIELCASRDCGVVVMHMKGTPRTMQDCPVYHDVLGEVRDFFEERFQTLTGAGISPNRIVFDPGIGFGKTLEHNLALLAGVLDYQIRGRPILMGLSRKSLVAQLTGNQEMARRDCPTQALTAYARQRGALIHRVHQVRECREALRMTEAVLGDSRQEIEIDPDGS